MSYLVLARKWRPQRFEEVIGQKHVSLILTNALKNNRLSHAYLFAGPRGVGKTSMARILAKALNCEEGQTATPCNRCAACTSITEGHCLDVLEIDGASNRGIDDIRQLRESVKYAPASMRSKVYIIDEVHMLTTDAFNALLKTLEEPPRHVCFIMATTEPLKVPPTILSRCQRFDFGRLTIDELVGNLRRIVGAETFAIDDEGLRLLARKAEGSVRDSLTLLDQVAAAGEGPFDAAALQTLLGLSGTRLYFEISAAVIGGDGPQVLRVLQQAYQEGLNLQEVAEELVHHFRNLLLVSLGEELAEILDVTSEERALLAEQMQAVRSGDALRWLRILLDVSVQMRRSAHGRVHLEVALVEMAGLPRAADLRALLAQLRCGGSGSSAPLAAGDRARGSAPEVPVSGTDATAPPLRTRRAAERSAGPSCDDRPRSEARAPEAGSPSQVADAPLADGWAQVCVQVTRQRAFLGSCLHGSRLAGLVDGRLQVALDDTNGFKREQVERPANRRFILRTMEEVFGHSVGLHLASETAATIPGNVARQTLKGEVAEPVRRDDASPWGTVARDGAPPIRPVPGGAAVGGSPPPASRSEDGAARVRRIADVMDGDIIGPAR